MADDKTIFQFRSRPEYFLVTALIAMSGLFTFVALSLWQDVGKNCQMAISSCSVGIDLAAGFVSLVVLSADVLLCRMVPWFLPGAFRLEISKTDIAMFASGSRIRLHAKDIISYQTEILSYFPNVLNVRRPNLDFRNWASGAPEYSGSAIHFDVRAAGRTERYSFPLGYYVFQTPDVQAKLEAALTQVGIGKVENHHKL